MADTPKPESTLRREADYAATQTLKESHLDEFNVLKKQEMKARGIDWQPKPTDKEKKAAELAAILAEYPDLAQSVTTPAVE
jgi:hypothetical protein